MKRKLLVIIESTPGTETKEAEGLRVAAGLAAWGQFEVTVCFKGALREDKNYPQTGAFSGDHLDLLRQSGTRLLQLEAAGRKPGKKKPASTGSGFERISMKEFASLTLDSQHTLVF